MLPTYPPVDILAFGAHPDDIEVGAGGLIIKWSQQGLKIGLIDLTQGESASNGTLPQRQAEAQTAQKILGAIWRYQLGWPCAFLNYQTEYLKTLIQIIRTYKPQIILAPFWQDRHSDHVFTSQLIQQAVFRASLKKILPDHRPHRPQQVFYYFLHYETKPDFIVDITSEWSQKLTAIQAHQSQFFSHHSTTPTLINHNFLEFLQARACYYGFQIGCQYGEPYKVANQFIGTKDPRQLLVRIN